jgi:Protein of unknown function (DUF2752)
MNKLVSWLEAHQQSCSFKEHFGFDCPGCGLQRSIIELLKGNIVESISLYPALIPVMTMFVFLALHLLFRFRQGALILKIMFIFNISLIALNYIYKLMTL